VAIALGKLKRFTKFISYTLLVLFLTALTQIGGILLLLALFLKFRIKNRLLGNTPILFFSLYLVFTFLIVPYLAPLFGREKVNHFAAKPTNYATVLLNRNYVKPELNELLIKTLHQLQSSNSDVQLHYLDANFPFIDKFPLLPHLSHNDGEKIDLSLVYQTPKGTISQKQKSRSGYGVFEGPKDHEYDQIASCKTDGYIQYDYPKYITFGKVNNELEFSAIGTSQLIKAILKQPELGKLFIEPHLKTRLKLNHIKILYHGCRAVRHDDHIHLQL